MIPYDVGQPRLSISYAPGPILRVSCVLTVIQREADLALLFAGAVDSTWTWLALLWATLKMKPNSEVLQGKRH